MSEIVTKIIQVLGIHYNRGRAITVIEFVGSVSIVSLQPCHILPTGTADFPMQIYNSSSLQQTQTNSLSTVIFSLQ